jgi:hypothetical protein
VTAFRATARLQKAMKARPAADPRPATNRLGEWTANLVRISRVQLVVAVSEPTRFGVVVDAAPYAGIPERFVQGLFHALLAIGVPLDLAAAEAEATLPLEIASSNSRSVLGTLNQYAHQIESDLREGLAHSALELTHRLADTIVLSPKRIVFPSDRARERFGLTPLDHRWMPQEGAPGALQ